MIFVNIHIDANRTERAVVRVGDTAAGVAERFAEEHGLSEAMEQKVGGGGGGSGGGGGDVGGERGGERGGGGGDGAAAACDVLSSEE